MEHFLIQFPSDLLPNIAQLLLKKGLLCSSLKMKVHI
ncbi:hypothetical protein NC651_029958 [Populus alba x Populus x berolinensis]|nr:hypothetical protein NC651_029958 [Populus alba x Populus x berolinensis]